MPPCCSFKKFNSFTKYQEVNYHSWFSRIASNRYFQFGLLVLKKRSKNIPEWCFKIKRTSIRFCCSFFLDFPINNKRKDEIRNYIEVLGFKRTYWLINDCSSMMPRLALFDFFMVASLYTTAKYWYHFIIV